MKRSTDKQTYTIAKIEADCNCGFRKFVSLTSFKSSFLLFADSV